MRRDKRDAIPNELAPILERLGMSAEFRVDRVTNFGRWFHLAAGRVSLLAKAAAHAGKHWFKGLIHCQRSFSQPLDSGRYTRQINFREGWRGHLWQGRFASFVMDEPCLLATARYVELNPVSAGVVEAPSEYPWSSARSHVTGRDDGLVQVAPLLEQTPATYPRGE